MEFSCEQIGLTEDELQARIVDGLIERLLSEDRRCFFDERLRKEVSSRLDAEVERIGNEEVAPKLHDMIDNFCLQKTNQWGEPKGEKKTFTEYIVERADEYFSEPVDHNGKPKGDSYSWRAKGTRMEYAIDKHLQYTLESAIKEILRHGQKSLSDSLIEAVKIHVGEAMKTLKVKVQT